jgi:peptidoglycan/xylan/chitin deacetylase (PgdA/CDA1 family)
MRAVLSTLHFSGADSMIAPLTRGIGVILMLQQVRPGPSGSGPNRTLQVAPQFLDQAIRQVRGSGFEIVGLDEAHFRLFEGDFRAPFACLAFDDGYRDTLEHAYPVLRRHAAPFSVYVPTDNADGRGDLWWLALERVVVAASALNVRIDGAQRRLSCATPPDKDAAYRTLYRWLRSIGEADARTFVRELCTGIGFDPSGLCAELMMNWQEVRQLAGEPLATIGAHTRRHFALAKLTFAEARAEIEESVRRIERETAKPCKHFSFPYGDAQSAGAREFAMARELGLKTAVTGRRGLIHARHAREPTALPCIALSGDYQKARYVKVLLSGAPFALHGLMPKPAGAA